MQYRSLRLSVTAFIVAVAATTGACSSPTKESSSQVKGGEVAVPASSVNDAMLACMGDEGWNGKMQFGGSIDWGNVPPEQDSQFSANRTSCLEETGWGDLAGLSVQQRRAMYELEVEEFNCLKDVGLTPPEPPTEQTYLDTFSSADQYYAGALLGLSPAQVSACPPPTWFMNW